MPLLTAEIDNMTDIVVAERVFRDATSGASVTASIFAPRMSEASSDWSCRIDIQGLEAPFDRSIFGVDSFQALQLATSLLCTILERHEAGLAFLDGPPGDCALPLIASCPPSVKADVREFIRGRIEDDLNAQEGAIEPGPVAAATHTAHGAMAERLFRDSRSGASVIARIFTPEPHGPSMWACRISVDGLTAPFATSTLGVDSFQALCLGLRRLCAHLETDEAHLGFPDGEPGDGSLPLIALCLPPSSKPEVYRFVEDKLRDHLRSRESS